MPIAVSLYASNTKNIYVSTTLLCSVKYLLDSVMIVSLQEETASRADHL